MMTALFSLCLLLLSNNATAQTRAVMEGAKTSNNTIFIDTKNIHVNVSTASYNGNVANVGLYSSSNIVISNNNADNCVIYATGSVSCQTINSISAINTSTIAATTFCINGYCQTTWPVIAVTAFGTACQPTSQDNTTCIQSAINWCYTNNRALYFPAGSYYLSDAAGNGYMLKNSGVNMYGDGYAYTNFYSTNGPNTSDFILITTATNGNFTANMIFDGFSINFSTASGTPLSTRHGRYGINGNFIENVSPKNMKFRNIYIGPGNNWSMIWNSSIAYTNTAPTFETIFEGDQFYDGVKFHGSGDSVIFRNNIGRGTVNNPWSPGVDRACIDVEPQSNSAGGQGSNFTIEQNNFDCPGGAIVMRNGQSTIIDNNDIEISSGAGTANGSVIQIGGPPSDFGNFALQNTRISNNLISIITVSTASSVIYVGNSSYTYIDNNRLNATASLGVSSGIFISNQAWYTLISHNQYTPSSFVNNLIDNGNYTHVIETTTVYFGGSSPKFGIGTNSPSQAFVVREGTNQNIKSFLISSKTGLASLNDIDTSYGNFELQGNTIDLNPNLNANVSINVGGGQTFISTNSYGGSSSPGIYTTSNVVVSNNSSDNTVLYSTGGAVFSAKVVLNGGIQFSDGTTQTTSTTSFSGAWTAFTTTLGGCTIATSAGLRYGQSGKTICFSWADPGCTSNATTYSITLPGNAKTTILGAFEGLGGDNNNLLLNPCRIDLTAGSTTATLQKDNSGDAWTASNLKYCKFTGCYETQ